MMKRSFPAAFVAAIGIAQFMPATARAQFPGDSVMLMYEADNAGGFDTFPGAREYPLLTPSFMMTVGGVSGTFTTGNARTLQVVNATATPFSDQFSNAGGSLSLNDPNFNVHDGLGEDLSMSYLLSDALALFDSNILADFIGNTYDAADFDLLSWEIRYNPPLSPGESLLVDFSSIGFSAGSTADLVKVTINGTVASNDITTPGSSLSIPEPATLALLCAGSILVIRRRRRTIS